jgi:hypothetical protein
MPYHLAQSMPGDFAKSSVNVYTIIWAGNPPSVVDEELRS